MDSKQDSLPDDAVLVPIGPEIDLHSFRPQEFGPVVVEYLAEAYAKGFRDVVLIHGKGLGIQRENVRKILAKTPTVESFQDAPYGWGGKGATLVHFKEKPQRGVLDL